MGNKSLTKARRNFIPVSLNLTSMMDMFTIILVFLLTQVSVQGQLLTVGENMPLPHSSSRVEVKPAVTVAAVGGKISVDGKLVEENFIRFDGMMVETLKKELDHKAENLKSIARENPSIRFRGEVLILADKKLPFRHLKKILYTCGQTEFINQSLAVLQR